jgi:hypothetical protein
MADGEKPTAKRKKKRHSLFGSLPNRRLSDVFGSPSHPEGEHNTAKLDQIAGYLSHKQALHVRQASVYGADEMVRAALSYQPPEQTNRPLHVRGAVDHVESLSRTLMALAESLSHDQREESLSPLRAWLSELNSASNSPKSPKSPKSLNRVTEKAARVGTSFLQPLPPKASAEGEAPDVEADEDTKAKLIACATMFSLCDHDASTGRADTQQALKFISTCTPQMSTPAGITRRYKLKSTISLSEFRELLSKLEKSEEGTNWDNLRSLVVAKSAGRKWREKSANAKLAKKNAYPSWTRFQLTKKKSQRGSFSLRKNSTSSLDGSAATTEEVDEASTAAQAIHPNSITAFRIILVTALLVIYSSIAIPFRLGFDPEEKHVSTLVQGLDILTELWFIFDMYVASRMGYVDSQTQTLTMGLSKIRAHYLRSWFVIDLLSSIPLKLLTLALPDASKLVVLKLLRLFKLFRLVKLLNLSELANLEDSALHLEPSHLRFVKIIFVCFFAVHVSSCCYWYFVRTTCIVCDDLSAQHYAATCYPPDNPLNIGPHFTTEAFCPPVWRVERLFEQNTTWGGMQQHSAKLSDEYRFAIHWSLMAMLGDNTTPSSDEQLTFASVLAVVGLGVMSTVIGALSAVITNMDALESAKLTHVDSIKSYLRYHSVGPQLSGKIKGFYQVALMVALMVALVVALVIALIRDTPLLFETAFPPLFDIQFAPNSLYLTPPPLPSIYGAAGRAHTRSRCFMTFLTHCRWLW